MGFLKIIIALFGTLYFSILAHIFIELWQCLPVKEEKRSHPLYITKEITCGGEIINE